MSENPPFTDRQVLKILSLSKDATAIYTSADLKIEWANEAMLAFWEKKEDIIGMDLHAAVPAIEQTFIDLLKSVWTTGKIYEAINTPAQLTVHGELKTLYFDFMYRPFFDPDGNTCAIMHTATEVSERIAAQEAMTQQYLIEQQLNEELAAANEEFQTMNEELSAINGELHSANEYSRITNEKLIESNFDLLQSRNQVAQGERMMRLAVDAAHFGTWHIAAGTRELIASKRLKELFGFYPTQEITLDDCLAQITEEFRDYVTQEIERALTKGGDYDISYSVKGYNDGKVRWIRAVGNLTEDENGGIASFTGIVMDITQQKEDEQRKNAFISMVSHELKTPLTSLMGYVQMLQMMLKEMADARTTHMLEKCRSQVSKMNKMITGFLDLSRIESGRLYLNAKPFQLVDLIEEVVEDAVLTSTTHPVEFTAAEPILVHADKDKIAQVVQNLISNAMKYSPNGQPIKVVCKVEKGEVWVSVEDKGVGIQSKDFNNLFTRFYRVENEQTHNIAGFGIGLYVCSEIIKSHDGKIWVSSDGKSGSTFYFTIPMK